MAEQYTYIIVGAGLAGSSAIEGIRELDKKGPILLLGAEKHLPYDRPPLTKKLWFGKKKVEEIFLHDQDFYRQNNVIFASGVTAKTVDAKNRTVTADNGRTYRYEKLLLATGGAPRVLSDPRRGSRGHLLLPVPRRLPADETGGVRGQVSRGGRRRVHRF